MQTYFVLDAGAQRIKIGRTTRLERRLRDLQHGCGSLLQTLHVLEGDEERRWHERFQADRLEGEWFRVSPAVAQALRDAFGVPLRSPQERSPRPPRNTSWADWAPAVEQMAGTGLRSLPREAAEDEDEFMGWLTERIDQCLPELTPPALDDGEEWTPEDDARHWEDYADDVEAVVVELLPWRQHLAGWASPAGGPRASSSAKRPWCDFWLAFWTPANPVARVELRRALVRAADASDRDAIEDLRLRPVLIDRHTGAVEAIPPEELYSDELMAFVLFGPATLTPVEAPDGAGGGR